MPSRVSRIAIAVVASAALTSCAGAKVASGPPSFAYAPGVSQYRITSSMKGAQEVMGQRNDIEASSSQVITVAVTRPTRDTLHVTTTIDSLTVATMGVSPPGMEKLRGTQVIARVSPTGQVYGVTTPIADSLPEAANLTYEMSNILPKVRPGLLLGASWTDTSSRKMSQGGIDLDRRTVAAYMVAGDTTIAGQKAWKVARTATSSITGSGAQGGQPMTVEGTSQGNGTMFVTSTGTYLGYTNQEKVNLKVVLTANGMEVGIMQDAVTKVEKIK